MPDRCPGVIGVRLGSHPEWTVERLAFSPSGEQLFVEAAGSSRGASAPRCGWG